jgi:DNA-directed RNA polymerase III subunit RPC1
VSSLAQFTRRLLTLGQAITVIPSRSRLRIYVDGLDKYYRLRDVKRGLAEVVVKVTAFPCYLRH